MVKLSLSLSLSLKSIRAIHLISRAKFLELLPLSQTLSKFSQNFSFEPKDSANMDKKYMRRNPKGKERARNDLLDKVHWSVKFRWHRFLKTGGTGSCRQNKDILVTYPFTFTFHPSSVPRHSTVKREVKVAIPWWFGDFTMEFKVWGEKRILQTGGTGFPSVLGQQQPFNHVRRSKEW